MKKLLAHHKQYWTQKQFLGSNILGILLLMGSLTVNHFASNYAIREASNSVNDIILDNIPHFNVDFILNEGVMVVLGLLVLFLFLEPKHIPFAIKSIALFIVIRSIFISLTHLGPPLDRVMMDPEDFMSPLSSGSDFFFSGHTGMPFLLALVLWDNKVFRYTAFAVTLMFGTAVILGHFHYSIDVFAAFFISYTIFHLATVFFPSDYKIMRP